ncbi:MAG: toll/interleukin-1 receptor domain-containing protein [Cyanobacteria bacterium P01_F01_bin.4]
MANQQFIFISYRRSDSISEAGRIYDSLSAHFDQECVFKDVFDIPYGVDFVEHLDRAVSQCQVLVAVIGNTWVDVTNAERKRRLDDPEDFVRIEIASALNRNILVIPLLVNDAIMPSSRQLPNDLVSLARRNAACLASNLGDGQPPCLLRLLPLWPALG